MTRPTIRHLQVVIGRTNLHTSVQRRVSIPRTVQKALPSRGFQVRTGGVAGEAVGFKGARAGEAVEVAVEAESPGNEGFGGAGAVACGFVKLGGAGAGLAVAGGAAVASSAGSITRLTSIRRSVRIQSRRTRHQASIRDSQRIPRRTGDTLSAIGSIARQTARKAACTGRSAALVVVIRTGNHTLVGGSEDEVACGAGFVAGVGVLDLHLIGGVADNALGRGRAGA